MVLISSVLLSDSIVLFINGLIKKSKHVPQSCRDLHSHNQKSLKRLGKDSWKMISSHLLTSKEKC